MANTKREQDIIKDAVTDDSEESEETNLQVPVSEGVQKSIVQEEDSMQQSVMTEGYQAPTEPQQQPAEEPAPQGYADYEQSALSPEQSQQEYSYGNQYGGYQSVAISPDTINEIAEQIVAEKLGPIATSVEKLFDEKATFEAQIHYLDDRLKRLEKIIDRLQLSILQKVGEYVSNVDDIKKEMIETQKSFKAMWDQKEKRNNIK